MGIRRGGFNLHCDHKDCDVVIDLETEDFDEARAEAKDHKEMHDWTTIQRGGTYLDICGDH